MEGAVIHDRGGHALHVVLRMELLGTGQMRERVLGAPVSSGLNREAGGPGIDPAGIDVPAELVGLATVEAGGFQAKQLVGDSRGDYIVGDVGGIFEMVAERRQRIFGSRGAM